MKKNIGRFSDVHRMRTTMEARIDGEAKNSLGNHVATGEKWSTLDLSYRCIIPRKAWKSICVDGEDLQFVASMSSPLVERPFQAKRRTDKDKVIFESSLKLKRNEVPDSDMYNISAWIVNSENHIVAEADRWTIGVNPKEFNASGGFPFQIKPISFRDDTKWNLNKFPNLGYAFRISTESNGSLLLVNTDILVGDASFAKVLLDKKSKDPTRDAMVCAIARGSLAPFLYAILFRVGSLDDRTINDAEMKCLSAFVRHCANNVPDFDPPRDDLDKVFEEVREMVQESPVELYNIIQQFADTSFNQKNEKKTIVKALGE